MPDQPTPLSQDIFRKLLSHRDRLWGLAFAILRDSHLAEDALQDAMVELMINGNYDPSRPLLPWALGVVRHKALKISKRESRYCLFEEPQLQKLETLFAERPEDGEDPRYQALEQALAELTPENRRLFLDKYLERIPVRNLSQRIGRSETATFSLIQRLRESLHRSIIEKLAKKSP